MSLRCLSTSPSIRANAWLPTSPRSDSSESSPESSAEIRLISVLWTYYHVFVHNANFWIFKEKQNQCAIKVCWSTNAFAVLNTHTQKKSHTLGMNITRFNEHYNVEHCTRMASHPQLELGRPVVCVMHSQAKHKNNPHLLFLFTCVCQISNPGQPTYLNRLEKKIQSENKPNFSYFLSSTTWSHVSLYFFSQK